jgi:hypothetical protein
MTGLVLKTWEERMSASNHISAELLKQRARGREVEILHRVGGIPQEILDGKHHPCPKCGGKDRFRLIDAKVGAVFCNNCLNKKNGDFLAALQWSLGEDFPEALRLVAEHLCEGGLESVSPSIASNRKPEGKPYATAEEAVDSLARSMGRPTAQWHYHDAEGKHVGSEIRWDSPKGKEFRPIALHRDGWRVGAIPEPRPLYELPKLVSADPDELVIVAEGPKAADSAASLGFTATTSSGGAKSWRKSDWSPLVDRKIVIWPDNDAPGEKYARDVGEHLLKMPMPAREVRIIDVPDMPEKGDAFEFVEAGRDRGEINENITKSELLQVNNRRDQPVNSCSKWPDPKPLPYGLPPVEPFDNSLLPETFRKFCADIAERMQCPPDFPAISIMVGFATIVGRRIGVRPKRLDDWLVIPNLWGVIIGRPSVMKSPALKQTLKPLMRIIKKAQTVYDELSRGASEQEVVDKLRASALEQTIKSKMKSGNDHTNELEELQEIKHRESPHHQRYMTSDTTVQALGELMASNPNGILAMRDELVGLLRFLDSDGQEAARAFFIEAWSGDGVHVIDRIGRGHVNVRGLCLSLLGTIQPGVLTHYLTGAVRGGEEDDGLIQRLQLAVWPDDPTSWQNVDRLPDAAARNKAISAFDAIASIPSGETLVGEVDPFDDSADAVPFLRFNDAAQDRFDAWLDAHQNRILATRELPAVESHLNKFRSLVPSLALLIHLAEGNVGAVELDALERAIRWAEYLETHARRIYSSVSGLAATEIHELAERIQRGDIGKVFTAREVYRKGWRSLSDKKSVDRAIDMLLDLDWLREEQIKTGGKPKIQFRVNQNIFEPPPDLTKPTKLPIAWTEGAFVSNGSFGSGGERQEIISREDANAAQDSSAQDGSQWMEWKA